MLSASRETIRRDLETLEKEGRLKRTHGGAVMASTSAGSNIIYTPFEQRKTEHPSYKEEVALEAIKYISDGQVIALDSGTTSLELAKAIKKRFQSLTVVTNSLTIANELAGAPGITLALTGGIYNPDEQAFLTDMATLILARININVLFLTTCGISLERGITYQRMEDITIQSKLMEASDKTIVIADSSKLGAASLVTMCGIEKISMIITDNHAPADCVSAMRQAGINVVISEERGKKDYVTSK